MTKPIEYIVELIRELEKVQGNKIDIIRGNLSYTYGLDGLIKTIMLPSTGKCDEIYNFIEDAFNRQKMNMKSRNNEFYLNELVEKLK